MKRVKYMTEEEFIKFGGAVEHLYNLTKSVADAQNQFNESVAALFQALKPI